MRFGLLAMSLLSGWSLVGCFAADDVETDTDTSELTYHNGQNLNGQNLNGQNLNGTSELGSVVKWVRYSEATLNGQELKKVKLVGSQILAKRGHQNLSGTQLVGAVFEGRSDTGNDLSLRIASAFAPGPNDDPTTWRYFVEYQETDDSWVPICVSGLNPVPSIPVDGYWDVHTGEEGDGRKITWGKKFLFACEQVGAIGKCIEAGYRPWQKVGHTSLDKYHQTCIRLLRADFCGTSESHTVDGSQVNIYDRLGIQVDTETWLPEAEWDKNGARCISPDATTPDLTNIPCYDDVVQDDCALEFSSHRSLMISERP